MMISVVGNVYYLDQPSKQLFQLWKNLKSIQRLQRRGGVWTN